MCPTRGRRNSLMSGTVRPSATGGGTSGPTNVSHRPVRACRRTPIVAALAARHERTASEDAATSLTRRGRSGRSRATVRLTSGTPIGSRGSAVDSRRARVRPSPEVRFRHRSLAAHRETWTSAAFRIRPEWRRPVERDIAEFACRGIGSPVRAEPCGASGVIPTRSGGSPRTAVRTWGPGRGSGSAASSILGCRRRDRIRLGR